MRKIILFIFVFSLVCGYAYPEDNILALDTGYNKKDVMPADKSVQKGISDDKATRPQEAASAGDDSDKELEKMKSYRETLKNKQRELEVVKLDLERESLLLKKKEAEKEIYRIDKAIPGNAKETGAIGSLSSQDVKDSGLDSSDMKLQLLVISDNVRQGQISLKGASYSFKEGDTLPFKLTVEKIDRSGVTLKDPGGTVLKLNFTD